MVSHLSDGRRALPLTDELGFGDGVCLYAKARKERYSCVEAKGAAVSFLPFERIARMDR